MEFVAYLYFQRILTENHELPEEHRDRLFGDARCRQNIGLFNAGRDYEVALKDG